MLPPEGAPGYSHRAACRKRAGECDRDAFFCKRKPNQVNSCMAFHFIFAQSSGILLK